MAQSVEQRFRKPQVEGSSPSVGSLFRGVAQLGSARALGAWGRGFKSLHPDSYYSPSDGKYGPVVKWPKTPPFHGGYSGSNPDGVILLLFPSVWAFSSVG